MSDDQRDDQRTDDEREGEGFLSRWSQRKAMARDGIELQDDPEVPQMPPAVEAEEAGVSPPAAESTTGEATAPPELPPLETLTEDSDYSAFLARDVSPELQRKALRKLFQSPKFNVRDGLDDYDLDFSNPEPLGDIVTAEMRHRIEMELERLARLEQEKGAPDGVVAAVAADGDAASEAPDNEQEIAEDDNEDDYDEQPLTS